MPHGRAGWRGPGAHVRVRPPPSPFPGAQVNKPASCCCFSCSTFTAFETLCILLYKALIRPRATSPSLCAFERNSQHHPSCTCKPPPSPPLLPSLTLHSTAPSVFSTSRSTCPSHTLVFLLLSHPPMALPSSFKPSRLISPSRARQLHRALKNLKLTLICGLLTVLVLRGALGAGKFGTPAKDFEEIKQQFERVQTLHIARKHANRVLTEVVEKRHMPLQAIEAQAQSTSYFASEGQSNDRLQGNYALKEGNLDVKVIIDLKKPSALSSKAIVEDRVTHQKNQNQPVRSKLKLMLVTGYQLSASENPTGDHYLLKFVKNKADYCKLHGIEILYQPTFLEAEASGLSAKLPILRKLMLIHPEVKWFWWMASDVLFTDMAFELPLEKYENHTVVLHGWDDMPNTGAALTSGSFLIRNCQESLNMLDTLRKVSVGQPNPNDQSVSAHPIIGEKRILGKEVFVENLISLHRCSRVPATRSEEETNRKRVDGGNESRPFMTRFVGRHKFCKKGANAGIDDRAPYLEYMERALDLADRQVLQLSSIGQKSSGSSAMRPLRGVSDGTTVSMSDVVPSTSGLIQALKSV